MQGKKRVSLDTCSPRAPHTSRIRVAYTSQLYSYLLWFQLTKIYYSK